MIPAGLLADAYAYAARVDSWLGSRWLGQVPVAGGSVSWTTGQQVQGSLSLTVPRLGAADPAQEAADFTPVSASAPLACMGQTLVVSLTVTSAVTGQQHTEPAGPFLVTGWEVGDDAVAVSARSLLERVEEDRLVSPTVPRKGGTLVSEMRRLLGGHMGLVVGEGLEDRACPSSMSWGESRIDALYELADAWPARLREGRDGLLHVLAPLGQLERAPDRVLGDGDGGTVVGLKRTGSRTQVYNRVVARGQEQDDAGSPTFQAVADQRTGPLSTSGPYGVVTKFFSSPLITSTSVARKTAETMLASSVRRSATVPVQHAPDPSVWLDEPVTLRSRPVEGVEPVEMWGRVCAVEMPLTHEGTARTDVEVSG